MEISTRSLCESALHFYVCLAGIRIRCGHLIGDEVGHTTDRLWPAVADVVFRLPTASAFFRVYIFFEQSVYNFVAICTKMMECCTLTWRLRLSDRLSDCPSDRSSVPRSHSRSLKSFSRANAAQAPSMNLLRCFSLSGTAQNSIAFGNFPCHKHSCRTLEVWPNSRQLL